LVEREPIDSNPESAGGDMPGYFEVRLSALVWSQSEVRMAEDRETLSADGSGGK
jgi:hypothetical protein